jgi:hypothetical protein
LDDDSLLRSFVTIKPAAEKILSDGTAKYRRALISFSMTVLRTMLNLKLQPLCEKGLIQTLILLRGGKIIPINIQDSRFLRAGI